MKILYLLHNDPRASGGTEKHVLQLATAAARDNEVAVFFPRVTKNDIQPSIEEFSHEGIRMIALDRKVHDNFLPPTHDERQLNAIYESFLQEYRPDVIHIHHLKNLPNTCFTATIICGARVVLTLHDFGIFCTMNHLVRRDGTPCGGSGGGAECALFCLPRAQRFTAQLTQYLKPMTGASSQVMETLKRTIRNRQAAFKRIHTVLAASQHVIDRYRSEGFDSPNMKLLELGIQPFEPPEKRQPRRPLKFIYIGNVSHDKGADLLIDTFSSVDPADASLSIHGKIVEKESESLIRNATNKYPNISFEGRFEESTLPDILAGADCLINPTRLPETFSLVLSEAWMARLPVIASSIGANAARIGHGINGLLFRPGDLAGLKSLVDGLVREPEKLDSLRTGIPDVMTMEKYFEAINDIYSKSDH